MLDHINLIGEDEVIGPVCISIEINDNEKDKKAILRTKKVRE